MWDGASTRCGCPVRGVPGPAAGRPLIVYSNHPSWWDPAVYILLCDMLFRDRAGYGPMDQAALGKYGVLERMGVFGVALDDPRGAATFLRTSPGILVRRPRNDAVGDGGGPLRRQPRAAGALRPGLAHLVRRVPDAVILPLALDYPFWNESRPEDAGPFRLPCSATARTGRRRMDAALPGRRA